FFQSHASIRERGAGGAFQLHIRAEGALLRGRSFEFLGHDVEIGSLLGSIGNLPQRPQRAQREETPDGFKQSEVLSSFASVASFAVKTFLTEYRTVPDAAAGQTSPTPSASPVLPSPAASARCFP